MEPVRWGIAGFGWVSRDFMAPAIREAGDRIAAVADPDPGARDEARELGARCYQSVAELAADPDVEAIYVATPNHLHRAGVEAAARAGKAVLCEKPMAATLADAEAMAAACSEAGVLYGTAFDQRHHPAHRALRDSLRGARVGTVTAVRIVYACWLGPDWSTGRAAENRRGAAENRRGAAENWRVDQAKAGGGALMDLAPHGLDLVGFLLDEPLVTVAALLQHRVHAYAVDDGATVMGRTRSGVLATLHVAYNCPEALPRRRLEVIGTRGMIVAEATMGQEAGGTLTFIDGATGRSEPLAVPQAASSPFVEQVRRFSHAFRSGVSDEFSAERDLATMRLIDRAYRAGAAA